jgi:hypothetical protein
MPRVGHYVPHGKADQHVGRCCAHCGFWFQAWGDVVDRKARHAGKAGVVCDCCWPGFVRGPIYRKHCGVA